MEKVFKTILIVAVILLTISFIYLMNENSYIKSEKEEINEYVKALESYKGEVENMLDSCYEYNEYIETPEYLASGYLVDSIRNTIIRE